MQGRREFLIFAVPGVFLAAVGWWWMVAALWGTSLDTVAMLAAYPGFGVFMAGALLVGVGAAVGHLARIEDYAARAASLLEGKPSTMPVYRMREPKSDE
jgi:hypothetical protein